MKYLLFLSLPLLVLIVSCSENGTGPITYTDAELKEKLVGSWSNAYGSVDYEVNGDFVENWDFDYNLGDSIVNQTEIMRGSYEINHGILKQNITQWSINNGVGGGNMLPAYKIVFTRNLLYLYPVEICTRIGDNTDSLWGEWYTFFWTHKYSEPEEFGKLEQTYNFNKDSMRVNVGFRSSFDSTGVFYYQSDSLIYNPPEVSWSNNNISRNLEFHGGQMYMFYKLDYPPNPFIKQK